MASTREELAFEEGQRAIEDQDNELRAYRQQAGVVVAGAGVAAGFLVGRAPVVGPFFVVGGAAFLGLLLAAGAVAWPANWQGSFDAYRIVSNYVDDDAMTLEAMQ